jgi:hypothetical protein
MRSGPLHLSSGVFHMTATVTSLPLCKHTGGSGTTPAFSGWLVCLQFTWRIAPPPLSGAQGALPSLLHVFLFIYFFPAVYYSVCFFLLFFPPGWGSVCPWDYADLVQGCLWEFCVLLSSLGGLCLPKQSGNWHLAAREPSCFLHLMWSGDDMCRLRVWRSQSFSLLGGFSCKVYHQLLSTILL